jgi:transcriptional regulator with XRE-family HTH domain
VDQASASLAERLDSLRQSAALTGEALARSLNRSPSWVSKVLNGQRVPSPTDTRAWAEACGHPELTDELLALRETATAQVRWRRQLTDAGETEIQQSFDDLTRDATQIRNAEASIVSGLLQIPGYCRGVFGWVQAINPDVEIDIDAAVDGRMRRREILHEEGRTFQFVLGYAALVTPPCPVDVMLAQLDRLMMATDLPNVTLGIIPQGVQLPMPLYNGFWLLDDLLVVENYGYEDQVTGEQATKHARIFKILMDEAATKDAARRLIAQAARELRTGKEPEA